jgi:hypothetical protein
MPKNPNLPELGELRRVLISELLPQAIHTRLYSQIFSLP